MIGKYSHKFKKIFNLTRYFATAMGLDAVREDYRMSCLTWSIVHMTHIAIIFTIYTMYISVVVQKDWTEVIKCLCMFCNGLQGYIKFFNVAKRPHVLRFLHKEITDIYIIYEKTSQNYHPLLQESIELVKKLIVILLIIMAIAGIAIIGLPFFYLIVFNERIFVMPFFFPYVNFETNFGFYLTSAFHTACVLFGGIGNFTNDSWCFIIAAHIPLMKNILKAKFNELDDMLLEKDNKPDTQIKEKLLDIFKWHQKYIVFCNTVKNFFFWVIFVKVAVEFISIVCTIVCVFLEVWLAAPVFLLYSYSLFFFYCALGNIVELANDDVTTMIYDCRWYDLTVSQQKMIVTMLRESQQAEGMSIGGIAPLSLNTALQLTKTIYTISMMLRNFF